MLISFNLVLLLLAVGIAFDRIPLKWFDAFVRGLHNTIGISTPTPRQVRWVAIAWIASTLLIVDSLAVLLTYVF